MNQLARHSSTQLSTTYLPFAEPRHPYRIHIFLYRESSQGREYLLFHPVAQPESCQANYWQGITGTLEAEESWENAANRAVFETSKLIIRASHTATAIHRYPVKAEWRQLDGMKPQFVEERIFYTPLENDDLPTLSSEYNAFGWFNHEKASRLLNSAGTVFNP